MPDYYDYNLSDNLWYQRSVPNPIGASLETLTNGRYGIVGDAVWDHYSNRPIVAAFPPTESHSLTVDEQGNWWLNSQTDASQINTMTPGHISWKGIASGKVQLPTGQTVDLSNQVFAVTKFNRQLWVRDVANPSRSDYIHVDVDRVTGEPTNPATVPSGFRPATASEAMTYGVAGLLASRHASAVQALLDRAKQVKK